MFFFVLISVIPIRTAIALNQCPNPQVLFALGGSTHRYEAAANVAAFDQKLDVWISEGPGGPKPKTLSKIFTSKGVSQERVNFDYQATDTVTNFTFLVPKFTKNNITHIYIVTSDYHMRRAKSIASLVLGFNGIAFTPLSVPTNQNNEPFIKVIRDVLRSIIWIFTGINFA